MNHAKNLLLLSGGNEGHFSTPIMRGHLHSIFMISYYVENEQERTRSGACQRRRKILTPSWDKDGVWRERVENTKERDLEDPV